MIDVIPDKRPLLGAALRPALLSSALALSMLVLCATPSAAGIDDVSVKGRALAVEVCADMVRDVATAAARTQLATPQTGTWKGRTYVCTYDFGDGSLIVSVDMLRSRSQAKSRFGRAKRQAPSPVMLTGIGQQGFSDADRVIVARKDSFLLTVDPRGLPARLDRDAIGWSATRAIFDCW